MMEQRTKRSLLVVMADSPSKDQSGWTKSNALAALEVYNLKTPENVLILGKRGTCYSFEGLMALYAQDRGIKDYDHSRVSYGTLNEKMKDGKFFDLLKKNGYEESELSGQVPAEHESLLKAGLCIIEEPSANYYFVGFPKYQGRVVKLEQKSNELGSDLIELIKSLNEADIDV